MYPKSLTPPKKRRRSAKKRLVFTSVLLVIAVAYTAITVTRPFAELAPSENTSTLTITTKASNLPWPSYGQGAFGLANGKVIATHGEQTPVPIASAAKVITALMVLERKPLAPGANGPTLTMTENDVALYRKYIAIDGSVTPVAVGQKLTQRDMLEALLLPSANNIADALAIWTYGSVENYITEANKYLQSKGLTSTRVGGDASGYLPDSQSSTSDLVKIGGLAMSNPTLAEILAQKTAVIPAVGTVRNYNSLLGTQGIVGIKTGNNDQNGGVFIGATTTTINGKTVPLITALSGASTLNQVLRDSGTLLAAVRTTIADTTIVNKDAILGTYAQPNGESLQAAAASDLSATVLRGDTVNASVKLKKITYNAKVGDVVGEVTIPATTVSEGRKINVILKQAPTKPGLWYRITHP